MVNASRKLKVLKEVYEILETHNLSKNEVEAIYLSGSRLYGNYTKESDYDIIVYVVPLAEHLVSGTILRKEYKGLEHHKYIDHIKVYDIRWVYKELSQFRWNSLHLLEAPLYASKIWAPILKILTTETQAIIKNSYRGLFFSTLSMMENVIKKRPTSSLPHVGLHVLIALEEGTLDYGVFSGDIMRQSIQLSQELGEDVLSHKGVTSAREQLKKQVSDGDCLSLEPIQSVIAQCTVRSYDSWRSFHGAWHYDKY